MKAFRAQILVRLLDVVDIEGDVGYPPTSLFFGWTTC